MKFSFAVITLLLIVIPTSAQTSNDLKAKYGEPQRIYEIRPGVLMTVTLNETGQACEMRIGRFAGTDSAVHLDVTFPSYLAKEIVDELVPESVRGAKVSRHSELSMRHIWARTEYYANVSITYWHRGSEEVDSNVIAIVLKWKNRNCKQN